MSNAFNENATDCLFCVNSGDKFSSVHVLTHSLFPQDCHVCVSCAASQRCWSLSAGCLSPAAGSTWADSSCHSNWPGPSPSTRARWALLQSEPRGVSATTGKEILRRAQQITVMTLLSLLDTLFSVAMGHQCFTCVSSWMRDSADEWQFKFKLI